jgi:hypothetical protein
LEGGVIHRWGVLIYKTTVKKVIVNA